MSGHLETDDVLLAVGLGLVVAGLLWWSLVVGTVALGLIYCGLALFLGSPRVRA